jgi:hypothetical protein
LISAQSHGTISLVASSLGTISAQLAGDTRPFKTVSSAEFVHDVNTDPICIVNGLTKNWRLPGWRICWVVGPRHCIDVLGSVGSYMDGGANHPLQKAALPFLHPDFVIADALALQAHFRKKRDFLIEQLTALGISVRKPEATFYIWADTSKLPAPINNGVIFFEYCIRFKVICVPVSGLGRSSCEFTWRAAVPSTARSTAPARSAHNVPCTCVSLTLASGHLLRHQPLLTYEYKANTPSESPRNILPWPPLATVVTHLYSCYEKTRPESAGVAFPEDPVLCLQEVLHPPP